MKNKLYIVEGQDRCGKSTLVNILRSKLANPKTITLHCGKPPVGVNPETWTKQHYKNLYSTIDFLLIDGYDVILDRSWVGELVYGPLYRATNLTLGEIGISGMIPEDQISAVILVDDAANLVLRSDGESHTEDLYMLEQERKLFVEAGGTVGAKVYDWNYEPYSKDTLISIANKMISGE